MIDPQDLRVTSYLPQSGHGAGGMTVGLTTSGIIVHHLPTGLGVSCDSERSQHANKEKALQLLESLLIAIKAQEHFEQTVTHSWMEERLSPTPDPSKYRTMGNKVNMIKEVREKAGCGLKEAKEAVDEVIGYSASFDDVIQKATLRAVGKVEYKQQQEGSCRMGDNCLCGGDVPAIREGCFEWRKFQ
jgi:protein subunit release factor B